MMLKSEIRHLAVIGVIVSAAVGCFLSCIENGFNFDDIVTVVRNEDLRPTTPWTNILKNDYWGHQIGCYDSHKSYRPITTASLRINYLIHELSSAGYFLVNIGLHAIISCLIYVLTLSWLPVTTENNFESTAIAAAAALVFACHPIHVDAIANATGRAEVLGAVFYMLGCLAIPRPPSSSPPPPPPPPPHFKFPRNYHNSSASMQSTKATEEEDDQKEEEEMLKERTSPLAMSSSSSSLSSSLSFIIRKLMAYGMFTIALFCKETAFTGIVLIIWRPFVATILLRTTTTRRREEGEGGGEETKAKTTKSLILKRKDGYKAANKEEEEEKEEDRNHNGDDDQHHNIINDNNNNEKEEEELLTINKSCYYRDSSSSNISILSSRITEYSRFARGILECSSFCGLILWLRWRITLSNKPHIHPDYNYITHHPNKLTRVLTKMYVHAVNLGLLFAPTTLSPDWSYQSIDLVESWWDVRNLYTALGYLMVLAIPVITCFFFIGVVKQQQQQQQQQQQRNDDTKEEIAFVLTCWAMGLASFLPSSHIMFTVGFEVAERVLYVPSIAFCMLAAFISFKGIKVVVLRQILYRRYYINAATATATRQKSPTPSSSSSSSSSVMVVVFSLFILISIVASTILGSLTRIRVREWKNEFTLYGNATRSLPNNAKLHFNYGNELAKKGRYKDALSELEKARSIRPAHYLYNLGIMYAKLNDYDMARRVLHECSTYVKVDGSSSHSSSSSSLSSSTLDAVIKRALRSNHESEVEREANKCALALAIDTLTAAASTSTSSSSSSSSSSSVSAAAAARVLYEKAVAAEEQRAFRQLIRAIKMDPKLQDVLYTITTFSSHNMTHAASSLPLPSSSIMGMKNQHVVEQLKQKEEDKGVGDKIKELLQSKLYNRIVRWAHGKGRHERNSQKAKELTEKASKKLLRFQDGGGSSPHTTKQGASTSSSLAKKKTFVKAFKLCRRALTEDPVYEDAWVLGAEILKKEGNIQNAISWLRIGLGMSPGSAALIVALARGYAENGEENRAIKSMFRFLLFSLTHGDFKAPHPIFFQLRGYVFHAAVELHQMLSVHGHCAANKVLGFASICKLRTSLYTCMKIKPTAAAAATAEENSSCVASILPEILSLIGGK